MSETIDSKKDSDKTNLLISVNTEEKCQTYFTMFGKKRRFPAGENAAGFIITSFLILIPSGIYVILTFTLACSKIPSIPDLINKVSNTPFIIFGIVSIITLCFCMMAFFDVSTSIPGYQTGKKVSFAEFQKKQPTLTIGNSTFILKYCQTCNIIRDIRTFHCQFCNMCVERHDHHCGYVSNCIGKNNLSKFFYFLFICFTHIAFVEITSVYMIVVSCSIGEDDSLSLFTVFFGILCVFVGFFFVFLIVMIGQHTFLISSNRTTNEDIRRKYDYTVYNKGCLNNWKEVCCTKDKQDEYEFEI